MTQLSVCIITKNESVKLEKCLQRLLPYGFEIVVVDTGSTDNTLDVANKYAQKVCHFDWCDDFAAARNFALQQGSNEYIMMIDSDEYIEKLDVALLKKLIQNHPEEVGRIERINFYEQQGQMIENQERINRIFLKEKYTYQGRIHEQVVTKDDSEYTTYLAPVSILHDGYEGDEITRSRKALRNIRLLEQENQEDPYMLYQLGKSYYMMGDYNMASDYLGKALYYDLNPKLEYVIDLVETYGYALLNSGQIDMALGLEGVEKEFGSSADFCFMMGLVYMNAECFADAIRSFEKAVACNNARMKGVDSYRSYYNAGVVCECLNDVEKARKYYQKCGNYKKAKERLEKLPAVQPHPLIGIVILSYNGLVLTTACIKSIRKNVPREMYELIVVDNASTDGSVEWLKQQPDIKLQCNKENIGFPKGCNQGIALAENTSDIMLLNNDTLVPPEALHFLQQALYTKKEIGAAGCISNYAPNYQNIVEMDVTNKNYLEYAAKYNVPMANSVEKKTWLVGFAILYKRSVLNKVGLLDERFTPGNYEDTDLGFRIAQAGYEQVLSKNSFVFHYGSKSFGIQKQKYLQLLETNKQKFIEKWGIHPHKYTYVKNELIAMLPKDRKAGFCILEAGCGAGATLARIQYLYPNAEVLGIEKEKSVAGLAKRIAKILTGDVEEMDLSECMGRFDYIMAGGIWEHMINPEQVLQKLVACLKPTGEILGSIYNGQNIRVLMRKETTPEIFTEEEGIFESGHRRIFTAKEWIQLCTEQNINLKEFSFTMNNKNFTKEEQERIALLMQCEHPDNQKQYEAYQYIFSVGVK